MKLLLCVFTFTIHCLPIFLQILFGIQLFASVKICTKWDWSGWICVYRLSMIANRQKFVKIVIFLFRFRKFGNRAKYWWKNWNWRKKWRKFGNATSLTPPPIRRVFYNPWKWKVLQLLSTASYISDMKRILWSLEHPTKHPADMDLHDVTNTIDSNQSVFKVEQLSTISLLKT